MNDAVQSHCLVARSWCIGIAPIIRPSKYARTGMVVAGETARLKILSETPKNKTLILEIVSCRLPEYTPDE